jgi:uncharacterized protein (TIGR02145 family)
MKKVSLFLGAVAMTAMIFTSCGGSASSETKKEVDNNTENSKEVTIGKQVWMKENLEVDKFRNGDPIPEVKTVEEWLAAGENKQPAWCYYNNNPDNGERYGKLYNWYAVTDPRGLSPEGWKIPSDEDWSRLTDFLGGESIAGKKMKLTEFLKEGDGKSLDGTNESGFTGLPGGKRQWKGEFAYLGEGNGWWSTTEGDPNLTSGSRVLSLDFDYAASKVYKYDDDKGCGFSVRCLKN